jgi:hypothetical protein
LTPRRERRREVDERECVVPRLTEPRGNDLVPRAQEADLAVDARIGREVAEGDDEDLGDG